jgi:hypothetical protein
MLFFRKLKMVHKFKIEYPEQKLEIKINKELSHTIFDSILKSEKNLQSDILNYLSIILRNIIFKLVKMHKASRV